MVGDEDVQPGGARLGHLGDRRDRAIGRDQQPRAAIDQALDGLGGEAVAFALAVGEVPVDLRAEFAQCRDEDRRRTDAVTVVVAVHGDRRATRDVAEHQLDGLRHSPERSWPVSLGRVEELTRSSRVVEPAPREHLREHAAHAELALE